MAIWPFYIADPTDPTNGTALFDFNGFEQGTGWFFVDESTFSLGGGEFEESWLSEFGVDGDVLATSRRPHARMEFDLHWVKPTSTSDAADLRDQIRVLNAALDQSGTIVCQPPGQDVLYIDYFPSPLSIPMRPGERQLFRLWTGLVAADGIHVSINRAPKMRAPMLLASVQKLHNAALVEDHDFDGIPTYWDWDTVTGLSLHDFSWQYSAYQVTHTRNGTNLLQQVVTPASSGQTWVFAFEVARAFSFVGGTVATVKARIEFLDGSNVLLGSVHDSAAVTPDLSTVDFTQVWVSAAAPSSTAKVRCSMVITNTAANANVIYLRKAQAEVPAAIGLGAEPTRFRIGSETVSMDLRDPFGKRLWLWGDGNTEAEIQLQADPSSGANLVLMREARRSGSRNSHASMQTFPGLRAVDAIAMGGASSTSDSDATGGDTLQGDVDAVYTAIVRVEAPQVEDTALLGGWHIYAAVRFPTAWIGNIQGRYGLADALDLPRLMRDYPIDMTDPSSSEYVELDFGAVDVPPGADGVFFEIWARRTGGSGSPFIDVIWPMPSDDQTSVTYLPGHDEPGKVATETWAPEDLVTPPITPAGLNAGEVVGSGDMVLNDTDEAAEVPEDATAALTAGVRHTYSASGVMYNPNQTKLKHGELIVYDITTSTQVDKTSIYGVKGSRWPEYEVSVSFHPTTGHEYSVYVQQTIDNSDGNIHIQEFAHSFIPPVVGGVDSIILDGVARQAYVLNTLLRTTDLEHIPPYPSIEPGLQLFRVDILDVAASGYDQVTPLAELNQHIPTRTMDVAFDQVPGWTN